MPRKRAIARQVHTNLQARRVQGPEPLPFEIAPAVGEEASHALELDVEPAESTQRLRTPERLHRLGVFTLAEDYHQKYYLRSTPLWREYTAIYPKMAELLGSTAVSRVNGYMTAYGASATLEREIDQLGLSAAGEAWLRKRVR